MSQTQEWIRGPDSITQELLQDGQTQELLLDSDGAALVETRLWEPEILTLFEDPELETILGP